MTPELTHKVEKSLQLIEQAAKLAQKDGGRLEVAYSGGKDSDILLHLARMVVDDSALRPVYHCTTIDPPGTTSHAVKNGVEVMMPDVPFFKMIEKKGLPTRWSRWCCTLYKESIPVESRILLGIRRAESNKRAQRYTEPEECRMKGGKKVRHYYPLLFWTNEDVREYITEERIECHPQYYDESGVFHVERRLGCIGCPLANIHHRLDDFRNHPKFFLAWVRAARKYIEQHPTGRLVKRYNNEWSLMAANLYGRDPITGTLFETDWERELKKAIGIL